MSRPVYPMRSFGIPVRASWKWKDRDYQLFACWAWSFHRVDRMWQTSWAIGPFRVVKHGVPDRVKKAIRTAKRT